MDGEKQRGKKLRFSRQVSFVNRLVPLQKMCTGDVFAAPALFHLGLISAKVHHKSLPVLPMITGASGDLRYLLMVEAPSVVAVVDM